MKKILVGRLYKKEKCVYPMKIRESTYKLIVAEAKRRMCSLVDALYFLCLSGAERNKPADDKTGKKQGGIDA
jgi:hypothetical protein